MTKTTKALSILGQIIFAWLYAGATNYCSTTKCTANSYISFILILISFVVLDLYFLKLYPRFKNIPHNILVAIILLFPVLCYLGGILLNAITSRPLSVIIIGLAIAIISRVLWMVLARGAFAPKIVEYLALKSLFLLILAVGFLIANLNFAISSYLKYSSKKADIYIVGPKSTFINYKFR